MPRDFGISQGTRRQRTVEFLGDQAMRLKLAILCVVLEPLRHLHTFFINKSRTDLSCAKLPEICDLLLPARSIIFQSMQYLGTLLAAASRWVLVWHLEGHVSLGAWQEAFPKLAVCARRCLMQAAAGVARQDPMSKEDSVCMLPSGIVFGMPANTAAVTMATDGLLLGWIACLL